MVLFRAHFKGSGVAKSKIGFMELLGKRFSIFVTLCKQEVLSTISQVILSSGTLMERKHSSYIENRFFGECYAAPSLTRACLERQLPPPTTGRLREFTC